MMRTDELITGLATKPWPATRPALRIAVAIAAGWLVALGGLMMVLGPPMAAVASTGTTPFAVKLGYTLVLAILSAIAVVAAGRPGQRLASRIMLVALPWLLVAFVAGIELTSTAPTDWRALLFGTTFLTCLASISLASIPVAVAVVWAYRILAPTRLALAGFLAGLSAGAAAAVAYALYCPETTASFIIASYTPAILVPALAGALLGPRLLRW